jgi:catechol 2,3-dioxygenase-like lactoylglutathione lyase family enzyme
MHPEPFAQEDLTMKRFHVHLGVPDLAAGIRFYSDLFGQSPAVEKPDYAKWMLDDPRVNFAISQRGTRTGHNHLGLQADSAEELADLRARFTAADARSVQDETNVSCCYARSDKHWVRDPLGIPWEAFHSLGSVPFFGEEADAGAGDAANAGCCGAEGKAPATTACCTPAQAEASDGTCRAPDAATTQGTGCCTPAPATKAARACCG